GAWGVADDAVGALAPAAHLVVAVPLADVSLGVLAGAVEAGAGAAAVRLAAPDDEGVERQPVLEGDGVLEADDVAVPDLGAGLLGGVVGAAAFAPLPPVPVGLLTVLRDHLLIGPEEVEDSLGAGGVDGADALVVDAVREVVVAAGVADLDDGGEDVAAGVPDGGVGEVPAG